METGKLKPELLKQMIEAHAGAPRPEVVGGGALGEDCAVLHLKEPVVVLSTDPVTAAGEDIGRIAYHVNINDIATTGAEPLGILVTILAPKGTTAQAMDAVMAALSEEAQAMGVGILGGHTEVTDAVNRMVVSVTALGTAPRVEDVVWTRGAKPGDQLLLTKALALEGTAILAKDFRERAMECLTEAELREAEGYAEELSVLPEGRVLRDLATAMHDITEGGILGALWELKEASGQGFRIYQEQLPVRPVTRKLCAHFGLDPLRFISSGSMLVAVRDGEKALALLQGAGIEGHLIGEVLEEGSFLREQGVDRRVDAPARDEIYTLYE